MMNIPEIKLGIVAVSRDCFPIALSQRRRAAVAAACAEKNIPLYEAVTIIENENDSVKALAEIQEFVRVAALLLHGDCALGPRHRQRFN